jgi:CAAX amino terminal protease family.
MLTHRAWSEWAASPRRCWATSPASAARWPIGTAAAIGEETFFRGAYQPRMGIVITSLLFASFHVQYSITPATLLILAMSLILGVLRARTSLSVCVLVHFLYNFTTVLLTS